MQVEVEKLQVASSQMPPTQVVAAIVSRVNTLESAMQDIWSMLTVPVSDAAGAWPSICELVPIGAYGSV